MSKCLPVADRAGNTLNLKHPTDNRTCPELCLLDLGDEILEEIFARTPNSDLAQVRVQAQDSSLRATPTCKQLTDWSRLPEASSPSPADLDALPC